MAHPHGRPAFRAHVLIPVSAYFAWWRRELAALVPARVKTLLSTPRPEIVVDATGPETSWSLPSGSSVALDAATPREVKAALRWTKRGARVVLLVPDRHAALRRIFLPDAARFELEAVLRYEIERATPFRRDEIIYGWQTDRAEAADGRFAVDLSFVPRAAVAEVLRCLESLGLMPSVVALARSDGSRTGPPLGGMGIAARRPHRVQMRVLQAGLVTFALVLLLAGIAVDHRLARRVAAAEALAQDLRTRTMTRLNATGAGDAGGAAAEAFSLRETRPGPIALLAGLTRAVPDSAYATHVVMIPGEIRLTGLAADAAGLVARLDGTAAFSNPRFIVPITRDEERDADRFSLELATDGRAGSTRVDPLP